jgi:hypothetical protein
MHRFKQHERTDRVKEDEITSFPCLLEEHAELRAHERVNEAVEARIYGRLKRVVGAVCGIWKDCDESGGGRRKSEASTFTSGRRKKKNTGK